MEHIIYIVIGIILAIGGVYAFKRTQSYLKLNTTQGKTTDNQFWGFALWAGYISGGIMILAGIILVCVGIF